MTFACLRFSYRTQYPLTHAGFGSVDSCRLQPLFTEGILVLVHFFLYCRINTILVSSQMKFITNSAPLAFDMVPPNPIYWEDVAHLRLHYSTENTSMSFLPRTN